MRIIAKRTLREYWEREQRAHAELEAWYAEAKRADWKSPVDIKAKYGSSSILLDGRVVFNISGNRYRLAVWINYDFGMIYIRFIGTHKEHDLINAQTI